MATTSIQATENNQKLFRQYTKKLSQDDFAVYASHADKLGRWLSDEKAYYRTARPEIVKLLMTAQSTLRRNVGADLNPMSPFNATSHLDHPMSDPYIRLVQAVKPYAGLFAEPDLRSFVGRIVQSASSEPVTEHSLAGFAPTGLPMESSIPQMPNVTGSFSSSHSDARTGSPMSFTHVGAQSVTSQSSPYQSNSVVTPSFGMELRQAGTLLWSEHQLASSSPDVNVPIKSDPGTSTATQQQQILSSSSNKDSISVPAPKPAKTKKKGRLDLSALLKKDVVALQQKKLVASAGVISFSSNQTQSHDTLSVKTEPTESSINHKEQVEEMLFTPTVASTVGEQSTHPTTIPVSLKSATEQPDIIDLTMDDSDGEMHCEPVTHEHKGMAMNVDAQPSYSMDVDNGIADGNVTQNILRDDATAHLIHPATRDSAAQLRTSSHLTVPVQQVFEADESTLPLKQNQIADSFNVDDGCPNTGAEASLVGGQSIDALEASSESLKEPTLPEEEKLDVGGDSEAFRSEMKVIAIQRGLESGSKISIRFEISDALFVKLSKWVKRTSHAESLQDSLCLSLGCYPSSELLAKINEGTHHSHEELITTLRSLWPTSGGLSMTLQPTQITEEFPLSPPFLVTEDGFVDVSQFMCVGQNVIELNHRAGLSNYVFVLHAHHPTGSQLHQIMEQRTKEQQWQLWTQHISRPLCLVNT